VRLAVVSFCAGLLLTGCDPGRSSDDGASTQVRIDLLDRVPWARVESETRKVEFGTDQGQRHYQEPDPRLHLDATGFLGFASEELDKPGLALACGTEARVHFTRLDLDHDADVDVTLEALGLDDGKGSQEVQVRINDRAEPIAQFSLPPAPPWVTRAFVIPADTLLDGNNVLSFSFERTDARSFPLRGEPFRYPVSAAFARLSFSPVRGQGQSPDVAVERAQPLSGSGPSRQALVLEQGTRCSFALRVPEIDPRFTATVYRAVNRSLRREQPQTVPFSCVIRSETAESEIERTLDDFMAGRFIIDADLAEFAGQVVSITITAAPDNEGTTSGRVAIADPVVIGRNHVDETPTNKTPSFAGKNLVLITLDAAAAGHLASYGANRGAPRIVAPTLNSLAQAGIVFEGATSPASYTLPSVASLFTGQLPDRHGVVDVQRPTRTPARRSDWIAASTVTKRCTTIRLYGMKA